MGGNSIINGSNQKKQGKPEKSLREMKRKQNAPKVWDKMKALLRGIQSQVLTLKKKNQVSNPASYLQKQKRKENQAQSKKKEGNNNN